MLNLIEISRNISLKSKKLHELCSKQAPRPLTILARNLAKQKPEFKKLPSDLVVFQMLKRNDDTYKVTTLCVYQRNGKAIVAAPNLDILEGFEILKYKTGVNGRVVLKYNNLEAIASIACSPEYLNELQIEELNDGIEGEGSPPVKYLKEIPQPETPLYSPILPHNEALEVISTGKVTREFSTPMVDLKDTSGNIYRNVITNEQLRELVAIYGNNVVFEIIQVSEYQKQKEDSKLYKRVDILRVGSDDFSDLEL